MGADALAGVMDLVARDAAQISGKKINVSLWFRDEKAKFQEIQALTFVSFSSLPLNLQEEKQQGMMEMFKMGVENQSDSYYTSSRMLDDGIIDVSTIC